MLLSDNCTPYQNSTVSNVIFMYTMGYKKGKGYVKKKHTRFQKFRVPWNKGHTLQTDESSSREPTQPIERISKQKFHRTFHVSEDRQIIPSAAKFYGTLDNQSSGGVL